MCENEFKFYIYFEISVKVRLSVILCYVLTFMFVKTNKKRDNTNNISYATD